MDAPGPRRLHPHLPQPPPRRRPVTHCSGRRHLHCLAQPLDRAPRPPTPVIDRSGATHERPQPRCNSPQSRRRSRPRRCHHRERSRAVPTPPHRARHSLRRSRPARRTGESAAARHPGLSDFLRHLNRGWKAELRRERGCVRSTNRGGWESTPEFGISSGRGISWLLRLVCDTAAHRGGLGCHCGARRRHGSIWA